MSFAELLLMAFGISSAIALALGHVLRQLARTSALGEADNWSSAPPRRAKGADSQTAPRQP